MDTKIEEACKIVVQYVHQLDALEDYVDSINDILTSKRNHMFKKNNIVFHYFEGNYLKALLNKEKDKFEQIYKPSEHQNEKLSLEDLKAILSSFTELETEESDGEVNFKFKIKSPKKPDENSEHVLEDGNNTINLNNLLDYITIGINSEGKFVSLIPDGEHRNLLREHFNSFAKNSDHIEQLYTSSVITLANNFELLISQLFSKYLDLHPNDSDFDLKNKNIDYDTLRKIGSVEEAKELLLEDYVTSIMKESAHSWLVKLGKINKKIFPMDSLYDTVVEFYQRRNIIIHNDGIVNTYYCNNVREDLRKGLTKGEKIEVTQEYILKKISEFKEIGLTIFWLIYQKLFGGTTEELIDLYQDFAFSSLKSSRYKLSRKIYDLILAEEDKISAMSSLICKINMWQTYKWSGEFEKVKNEIKNYDFSLASSELKMGRAILLDNFDEALVHLKNQMKQLEEGETEFTLIDGYFEWPLFKDFILFDGFKTYLEEIGYEVRLKREPLEG